MRQKKGKTRCLSDISFLSSHSRRFGQTGAKEGEFSNMENGQDLRGGGKERTKKGRMGSFHFPFFPFFSMLFLPHILVAF